MGVFGNTPYEVAETIASDIAAEPDAEMLALGYAYMALEDVNYHSENRQMIQKFGEIDAQTDYVMSGIYYDLTPGSSFDFDPAVAIELAIIVAERNHPALASWLKRI